MSSTHDPRACAAAAADQRGMLRRLDVPGPRYTSYPTADRFVEAFGEPGLRRALAARHSFGGAAPLSLHVYLRFCESVRHHCACREVALDAALVPPGRAQTVTQRRLGGGTPTFRRGAELARLTADIRASVVLARGAALSVEIEPRTVDAGRLSHLTAVGFNRLNFGVQDFDRAVQRAVHRNAQGCSTQPDRDLIGLGVCAIRRIGATCSQSAKAPPHHLDAMRFDCDRQSDRARERYLRII